MTRGRMPKYLMPLAALALLAVSPAPARAQVMLRDLVSVEGVRSNQLVGYGLVVGLASHRRHVAQLAVHSAVA